MTKNKRQNIIRVIIEKKDIETQDDLLTELKKEGVSTTQATISRDIREMNLVKISGGNGRQKYALSTNLSGNEIAKYQTVLGASLVSIDYAGNLIVIHTSSGMAMAVAAALDNMNLQGFMGCIAGDDTVFCAVKSPDYCKDIIAKIKKDASEG